MKKKFSLDKLDWAFMILGALSGIVVTVLYKMEGREWEWPLLTVIWIGVAMRHKSEADSLKKSSDSKKGFFN